MMRLDVDSSVCTECHTDVAGQYEHSKHAGANVQCVGCHVAHSQDLRLTNQSLCTSCHREALKDSLHTAHWVGDVSCTNCHMEESLPIVNAKMASAGQTLLVGGASHDFVTVSPRNCLGCHREEVKTGAVSSDEQALTRLALLTKADQVPALRSQVQQAEATNRTLSILNVVTLGGGIGLGGILGIAFMLVVARFGRNKGAL